MLFPSIFPTLRKKRSEEIVRRIDVKGKGIWEAIALLENGLGERRIQLGYWRFASPPSISLDEFEELVSGLVWAKEKLAENTSPIDSSSLSSALTGWFRTELYRHVIPGCEFIITIHEGVSRKVRIASGTNEEAWFTHLYPDTIDRFLDAALAMQETIRGKDNSENNFAQRTKSQEL